MKSSRSSSPASWSFFERSRSERKRSEVLFEGSGSLKSFLVLCESLCDASNEANGYNLLSALASKLKRQGILDVFSHEENAPPYVVSNILQISASPRDYAGMFKRRSTFLRRGERFAFRVSFLSDAASETFLDHLGTEELRLAPDIRFRPVALIPPGEHALCADFDSSDMRDHTFASCRLRFLSPTGFNRNGLQIAVPLPELVFGSLLGKWRSFVSDSDWSGVEEFFPGVRMEKFAFESRSVRLKNKSVFRGSVGYCDYFFDHLPPEGREALSALALFSFFAGIGYKTAQGMGQVFPESLS